MRSPALAVLSLLALSPSLIAAAPHESLHSNGSPSTGIKQSPRPWRQLSDAIIRRVWGLEDTKSSSQIDNGAASGPGRDLIARYGEDIVLRFTIKTAEEASALAEAAEILFLDVWEFNSDWVDIRIAKDVVRLPPPPSSTTAY